MKKVCHKYKLRKSGVALLNQTTKLVESLNYNFRTSRETLKIDTIFQGLVCHLALYYAT